MLQPKKTKYRKAQKGRMKETQEEVTDFQMECLVSNL